MADIENTRRRGPLPGILREEPLFPARVKKIIKMRQSGLTLREIARALDITPAGVNHIIKRWSVWAEGQEL
jgi:hypothetical protein